MKLVKIKAEFDPSNADQLTAAMNFLAAVGGAVSTAAKTAEVIEPKEDLKEAAAVAGEVIEKAQEAAAPKKRATRKKAVEPKQETPETEQPETKEAEAVISLEDIRALTSKKAKEHREAIKAKLTEWGAPNVVKIPEEKHAEFMDFLNAL